MQFLCFVLFILVVALQAADGFLTWRILRAGGRELNPLVKFFMDRLGFVPGLVVAKLVPVAVAIYVHGQLVPLLVIAAVYAWVVLHNWRQLFKPGAKA